MLRSGYFANVNDMNAYRIVPFLTGSCAFLALAGAANAEIDLRNASVSHLDNGLTVILLEDRNFPVVSVQSLYRIGARNETTGQTGLAHFLEHMAFRASESFPGTGVVSEIYALGGEWHGYTWLDQTTYFATLPKQNLDTLLRIEAERMYRLTINASDMEAERGAVLAEMHGYENDPITILFDTVLFTSFLGHPYRNNTIGWQSDIENLRHEDVVAFYRRHYVPANAVIAIAGDFDAEPVSRRIEELFGSIDARPATPLPHTVEPPQTGERRVHLSGPAGKKYFKIAYRAPSASSTDFAAFLVLQDWLGASSGVSFLQNDWGTSVRADSLLGSAADDLATWFPPSAQDYVFVISGNAEPDAKVAAIESEIERRVAIARNTRRDAGAHAASIRRVLDELVFDVETTEDAAHQLAFFDGLNALDDLLVLPEKLKAVTPREVQDVARRYLQPRQRTIGWWTPGDALRESSSEGSSNGSRNDSRNDSSNAQQENRYAPSKENGSRAMRKAPPDRVPVPWPQVAHLRNGIPVIVTESDFSSSGYVRVIVPNSNDNVPVHGHSSLDVRFRPAGLTGALGDAALALSTYVDDQGSEPSTDPESRLEQSFAGIMGKYTAAGKYSPSLIVIAGDIKAQTTIRLLDRTFGKLPIATADVVSHTNPATLSSREDINITMGRPLAQSQLGYIIPAPGPRDPASNACRLLLYILSHHYEGRLGKAAITDRGLVYYIDSRYLSDGTNAWITLASGVDPEKLNDLRSLFRSELERLSEDPPSAAEIAEARTHLVGRAVSAAQSNEELSASQARQWIWHGRLQTPDELRAQLEQVSDEQVRATASQFANGTMISVTE